MNFLQRMTDSEALRNIITSVLFVVMVLVARFLILRTLRRSERASHEARLRGIVYARNLSLFVLVLGVVVIWAAELRAVAFSFAALAVAIVIATKELILCLLGGILRGSDRPFSVGDRIEVQHFRGDVIDQSLFTTTMLEIGPGQVSHQYTGRAVVFPNSVFLSNPIINETFTDDYVLHVITFPISAQDNWRDVEIAFLRAAQQECAPFLAEAKTYLERLARDRGLDPPNVSPRVSLHFPEPGRINLFIRIPAPARRKGRIEQAILRRFLNDYPGKLSPPHAPTLPHPS